MSRSHKHHINTLQDLGFSNHEARTYLALLQRNPATAYEVSRQAELPHANVYRSLEALVKKSAVQPVSEKPKRFAPVSPGQLLGAIARRTTSACQQLADKLADIDQGEEIEYVWLLEGTEETQARIEEMISGAREHLWIKAHQETLDIHFASLKKAAGRGVNLVVILIGNGAAAKRYKFGHTTKVFLHEGTGQSGIGLGRDILTMTTDFSAALTVDTREGGHGAFTRSGPVVNLANTMIRHEIYVAEIFNRFGPQIEKAFGPALLSIRQHYLPKLHVDALKAQIGTVKKAPRS